MNSSNIHEFTIKPAKDVEFYYSSPRTSHTIENTEPCVRVRQNKKKLGVKKKSLKFNTTVIDIDGSLTVKKGVK